MEPKPLQKIRILELGGYISVPYATSLLCALGADVVKVERAGSGDDFRVRENIGSPFWLQYNTGKRSLSVDLKSPQGVELVKALIPRFDVVIENMRPGKMDALGLGKTACQAVRPDLVYASVSGFGSGGPLAQRAAYDTIGQAAGGLYSILSDADRAQLAGTCLADLITGVVSAAGVLAALVGRGSSGQGQFVETSLMEAVSTLTVDAMTLFYSQGHREPSRQSRHPQAQNFCLKTASEESIAIHLSGSDKFWRSFIRALGREDLATDPRFATYPSRIQHYAAIVDIAQAEFVTRPAQEWEKVLTEEDVPFFPVQTMSDFVSHPQTEWLDLVGPERDGLALMRPPWRFDGARPSRNTPAPRVGAHTREIAAEVYDRGRIEELIASGVLFAEE